MPAEAEHSHTGTRNSTGYNPQAAAEVVQAILADIQQLARFRAMGREGRIAGTREWTMPSHPYLTPYRVRGDRLQVLRIFHTRRLPPEHW
jgi:plasmid stabilization system protein ParE